MQTDERVLFVSMRADGVDDGWTVTRLESEESLHEAYRLVLHLSNRQRVSPDKLLGRDVHVTVGRDKRPFRTFHGRVCSVIGLGLTDRKSLVAQIEVRPYLHWLAFTRDARIFQRRSVPEILEQILKPYLVPAGRGMEGRFVGNHLPREYTVQYDESTLDFALRMMEEEGLTCWFEHVDKCENLVVTDDMTNARPCGLERIAVRSPWAAARIDTFESFSVQRSEGVTAVDATAYDWSRPMVGFSGTARLEGTKDRPSWFVPSDYGRFADFDESERRYRTHDLEQQTRWVLDAQAARSKVARAKGDVLGLKVGSTFEVYDCPAPSEDGSYLVTRLRHTVVVPQAEDNEQGSFVCEVEAVPARTPWRPLRTHPKPRVAGFQNARVVGPVGQEIYTDQHGRVKVQFPWDRYGKSDENSSCWLRVLQSWGGTGWGTVFIPRIGQEVIVGFVEGDIDRPVVVSAAYNGTHALPYDLPKDATKSGIRTNSSPGGGGSNEITFDDKKGEEQLFIHAQKDLAEVVENSHSLSVKASQSISAGSQSISVEKDQSVSVQGNRSVTVASNETVGVQGKQDVSVSGNASTTVTGTRTVSVQGTDTQSYSSEQHVTVTGAATQSYSADLTVAVTNLLSLIGKMAIDMSSDSSIVIRIGESSIIELKPDGIGLQSGQSHVVLNNDGTIGIFGQKVLIGGQEVSAIGQQCVLVQGNQKVDVVSGPTAVTLEGSGVTLDGPKITSAAKGLHEIQGALVKIG